MGTSTGTSLGLGWGGSRRGDVTCPDDLLDLDAGDVDLLGEVPQGHPGVLVGQGVDVQLPACHRHPPAPAVRHPASPPPRGTPAPPSPRLQGTATRGCHHRHRGDAETVPGDTGTVPSSLSPSPEGRGDTETVATGTWGHRHRHHGDTAGTWGHRGWGQPRWGHRNPCHTGDGDTVTLG